MIHSDIYSPGYTLQCLVEEGYLLQNEVDELIAGGATQEAVVQAVTEILLAD